MLEHWLKLGWWLLKLGWWLLKAVLARLLINWGSLEDWRLGMVNWVIFQFNFKSALTSKIT